ncbi:alpha/beta hydrolase [Gryllotalpicola daejeonensis]|uniref:Alpha/beta hydrolase n=1 Tax=Gryllotalpicola daejeonensis TaxID=993087 RepID=A0ABP7ZJ98_9MICO
MTETSPQTRTILVLHGGGGPATVAPIAAHFAGAAEVLAPTLPGWNGTPRPDSLDSARALAAHFLEQLTDAGLHDVVVIGNSLGGWIAAEMAIADTDGRVGGIALIDVVGIEVEHHPIRDISGLTPQQLAQYSFHDPSKLVVPPPTPEGLAIVRGNQAALAAVAGTPYMHDPALRDRLSSVHVPTLVVWGESDRVVTPDYGRAFAAAIPGARFELVGEAGHLPQLENPGALFAALDAFVAAQ